MTLVRWNPIHEIAGVEFDRLNRLFSDLYKESVSRAWVPPVDIYEAENRDVVIKAELPDMKREQISVTFENNVLTLKGERAESEVSQDRFRRVERRAGTFSRSFTLPNTADASAITAAYKDGILTVRIPQREEAKPKQIAVE
jgi:HSP20 family protein